MNQVVHRFAVVNEYWGANAVESTKRVDDVKTRVDLSGGVCRAEWHTIDKEDARFISVALIGLIK